MSRAAQGPVRLPVWRARVVLMALVAGFAVLGGRAVYLQAMRTDFLQEKGDARYSRVLEIPATRGRILDRNGEALAVSTAVKSVWVIPGDIEASGSERRKLAALLAIPRNELEKRLTDSVREIGQLRHHEARVGQLERQLKERDDAITQLRGQLSELRSRPAAVVDDPELQPSLALGERAPRDLDDFDDEIPIDDDDELV